MSVWPEAGCRRSKDPSTCGRFVFLCISVPPVCTPDTSHTLSDTPATTSNRSLLQWERLSLALAQGTDVTQHSTAANVSKDFTLDIWTEPGEGDTMQSLVKMQNAHWCTSLSVIRLGSTPLSDGQKRPLNRSDHTYQEVTSEDRKCVEWEESATDPAVTTVSQGEGCCARTRGAFLSCALLFHSSQSEQWEVPHSSQSDPISSTGRAPHHQEGALQNRNGGISPQLTQVGYSRECMGSLCTRDPRPPPGPSTKPPHHTCHFFLPHSFSKTPQLSFLFFSCPHNAIRSLNGSLVVCCPGRWVVSGVLSWETGHGSLVVCCPGRWVVRQRRAPLNPDSSAERDLRPLPSPVRCPLTPALQHLMPSDLCTAALTAPGICPGRPQSNITEKLGVLKEVQLCALSHLKQAHCSTQAHGGGGGGAWAEYVHGFPTLLNWLSRDGGGGVGGCSRTASLWHSYSHPPPPINFSHRYLYL
ncbi:hypothetical protein JZ751_015715 [Albula glossodonta]|uniref:Ras-GAP domain-containing protein n=1 Tax=Albula glossodonta TaxID=121402 RepID=A0A8T2MUZ4_9TELE|nr:hypothetical protein JZ751_015715 [Albula glossodonta]